MLPIGPTLTKFPSGKPPVHGSLKGRYVTLELVDPKRHGHRLYEQSHVDEATKQLWTYMPYGPWDDEAGFMTWLASQAPRGDTGICPMGATSKTWAATN